MAWTWNQALYDKLAYINSTRAHLLYFADAMEAQERGQFIEDMDLAVLRGDVERLSQLLVQAKISTLPKEHRVVLLDWHFHENSNAWIWGVVDQDGCFLCDGQMPMILESGLAATEVIGFSMTEEALAKFMRRTEWTDPGDEFFIDRRTDEDLKLPKELVPELEDPNKHDMVRWRKQFAPSLELMRGGRSKRDLMSKDDPDEIDPELLKGRYQPRLFGGGGDVIQIKRRKKRKSK